MSHAGIQGIEIQDPVRRNRARSEVLFMRIAIVAAMLFVAFSSFPLAAQQVVVGISLAVNR
jgi:hypothetical protein